MINPKISVIVQAHNNNHIIDAFDSLLNQSIGFDNLEVIFVDVESDDLILGYADKYDNVSLIVLENSYNSHAKLLTEAIKNASADYVMFLNHCDVLFKDACEIIYSEITDGEADFASGVHVSEGVNVPNESYDDKCLYAVEDCELCSKIFNRNFIIDNIEFPKTDDIKNSLFLFNCFLNAESIKFIDKPISQSLKEESIDFSKDALMKTVDIYFEMYYSSIQNNMSDEFKRFLISSKLNYLVKECILKCNLPVSEMMEVLIHSMPLFKTSLDYRIDFNEDIGQLAKHIAERDFENALRKIYGENIPKQRNIKVAAILDQFSHDSFKYEFELIDILPDSWVDQFETEKPDLFFCESAYHGVVIEGDVGVWNNKVFKNNDILREIIKYCNERNIPTVFWNKEDPISFNDAFNFTDISMNFDYIFTSCEECIPLYNELGHAKTDSLMFAAQPRLFNPIEHKPRLEDVAVFAGSWYEKFPERCRVMESIFDKILDSNIDLKIYDRFSNKDWDAMKYPEKYLKFVNDGLDYSQIPEAYKESEFGLNFNTVTKSNTMFARRVFELMASNTLVLSNYSKGVYRLFKNNVFYLDRQDMDLSRNLNLIKEENLYDVLENHTYSNRFRKILDTIYFRYVPELRHIVLFYELNDLNDLIHIQNHFLSIDYPFKHLKIVTDENYSYLSGSIQKSDLSEIDFDDNYYFCFADLNLNADFIKKAVLSYEYIEDDVGIKENAESRYSYSKTKEFKNVIFNSSNYMNVISDDFDDLSVFYV